MGALISIANTQIFLEGTDFDVSLNSIEKKLLTHFIVKKDLACDEKNGHILAKVKYIKASNAAKGNKPDPELVSLIKARFCYKEYRDFEKPFRSFIDECLMPYLKEQPSDQERLKALLRNHSGNDGILIQPNAFALRDAHNRSYELIYRKTNRSPEQDSLQIGNLRAFGLLFRMAFHLEEGGLMLHASSLEKDGAGYVFVGPSNAGKSTVAAMLKPDRILSDDIALIKRVGDTYSLYSNPWWSISSKVRISRPLVPAPLKALFFIEKARKNRMERLSYKEALSSFVYIDGSFQQAGFFNNKDGIRDFYAFAHELVKKVPAFRLDFKKSPELEGFFYRSVARYL